MKNLLESFVNPYSDATASPEQFFPKRPTVEAAIDFTVRMSIRYHYDLTVSDIENVLEEEFDFKMPLDEKRREESPEEVQKKREKRGYLIEALRAYKEKYPQEEKKFSEFAAEILEKAPHIPFPVKEENLGRHIHHGAVQQVYEFWDKEKKEDSWPPFVIKIMGTNNFDQKPPRETAQQYMKEGERLRSAINKEFLLDEMIFVAPHPFDDRPTVFTIQEYAQGERIDLFPVEEGRPGAYEELEHYLKEDPTLAASFGRFIGDLEKLARDKVFPDYRGKDNIVLLIGKDKKMRFSILDTHPLVTYYDPYYDIEPHAILMQRLKKLKEVQKKYAQ